MGIQFGRNTSQDAQKSFLGGSAAVRVGMKKNEQSHPVGGIGKKPSEPSSKKEEK